MLKRWGSANLEVDGSKMSRQLDNVGQHRRRLSMGSLLKDQNEDLTLFLDMQKQEISNFLHLSNEDIEASLRSENLQPGVLSEKGSSDLLIADPDKNDYDWLLTPPETPLFPSLDQEVPGINFSQQGAVRTVSSYTSEFHGPQSSLSAKASKGYPNMKRSSSFSLSNNEGSLMKVAPSKAVSRASRSQPSTPTGNSRTKNAAGRSSHNAHQTVMTSFGTYSNCKVTSSSARCSPSARGVSPSKRPQTPPYQMTQLSFSCVPPPNLRTSISDHSNSTRSNSTRSTSAHLRHKRNASAARVNSHSTWMDSNNHLRWSTVSASSSISCSSSTSLDRECFSPNSSRGSVTSLIDEVQAVGLTTDLGPDGRRISRSYDGNFAQLSSLRLKRPVFHESAQINFQPFMPDSPTSFSSNASSSLQYSSSNSISIFAAQSERSDSVANESEGSHGGDGLFRDTHKDTTQSNESSFSHKEKDDLLTEKFNIKNHQENLNVSYTSEFDCLFTTEHVSKLQLTLQKDSDPYTHLTVAVESVNEEHGLYLPDTSHLSSVQVLQLVTGGGADMINEEDNISCTNVCQRAQNIPKLWCSSELDPQRQSGSSELRLNLKDEQVLEKLEQYPGLELVGETGSTCQNARHASASVALGSAEESVNMESKHKLKPGEATQVISNSNIEVLDEHSLMLASCEESFLLDPAARSFGPLRSSSCGSQSSNGLQEGRGEVWSSKKFGVSNLAEEHTDFDRFPCTAEIWPGVEKGITPTSVSVQNVPLTSEEMLLVEGSGVNGIRVEDPALMPVTKRNDSEEINATGDSTLQNICIGNRKDILEYEVLIVPKAGKEIGEKSPSFLEKQHTGENGLIFGTDFPDSDTGMSSNEEIHSSLAGNDLVKAAKLLKENIDERFVDYGLDSLQLPGFSNKFSADSSLYYTKTKQRGNDYPQLCLEVETEEVEFCTTSMIVKGEVCCTEEKSPVMNGEMPVHSDALVLMEGNECQDNMHHFVTHASEKNEELMVLDLQLVSSTTSETFNPECHLTSNHPSKLTDCGEEIVADATTASTDDDRGEREKYGAGMQLMEPILSRSSLNEGEKYDIGMKLIESILSGSSSNAESSFYYTNAAASGDSITTNVVAPSPGSNTDVCASTSSLLWDKRLLEATDTILFCSSIVHDIIYKASTLAIEKEASNLVAFPTASNKDLPVLFENSKTQNGIRGKAAKSCKIQAVGEEQITRQKLIYMQQQNRIDSTIVSHPENSAMQIDVKQQEEPVNIVVKSNQSKDMPRKGHQPKCHCTIL